MRCLNEIKRSDRDLVLKLGLRTKLLIGIFLILLPILGLLLYGLRSEYERRVETVLDSQMQTAET
ncbi:MAG: hypothetical protein M1343_02330, partial [Chloroflexi bacterium]|nr:hypothetical protein [Chloroflexota bacterium]MDA8189716.1 hypothetical protein [Dehalococcoidales bacterium]